MTATDGDLLAVVLAPAPPGTRPSQGPAATAWRTLVERHSGRMFAVGRGLGLDAQTAEDLVQTAWLRLLERGDQLRERDAVGGWLCTIVRNEGLRLVTRRRELPMPEGHDEPSAAPDAVDGVIAAERAAALRFAFARLDEPCRRLLRLTLADPPLSYDEIAAAIGRPRGALGPTRRRCLDRLRGLLPAGHGEPAGRPAGSGRAEVSARPQRGPQGDPDPSAEGGQR